jgi:site-specific DNA-methyltransferase (adenine-specific)
LLLTDPPYGINADRDRNSQANGWVDYGSSGWDKIRVSDELLSECRSHAKYKCIWGGNYFALPPIMGWLCWDKGQRDFSLADGELAWTSENRAMRIFTYSRAQALQDGRVHPTQKPIALMKWCISLFPATKTVLDPFCGSGTTLVAAKDMGLLAAGIEAEERYCEIAANRLRQSVLNFEPERDSCI